MFGSARGFLSSMCTLSLIACSLETPGARGPHGEPLPAEMDAEVVSDAAAVTSDPDAAVPLDAALDAAPPSLPDASLALDANTPPDADVLPDVMEPTDAAADATTLVDGGAPPPVEAGAPDAASSCRLEGAFGVDVQFDVSWNGTTLGGIVPLLQPGSGKINIIGRLDLRGGALKSRALVSSCGAALPDFEAGNWLVGNENYAGYIPDESWDRPSMPRWDLGWEVGCDQPGCSILTDLLVAVIGARSAAGDVWPGRKGPLAQIVPFDHDDDGSPAITLASRDSNFSNAQGVPYKLIPVAWTLLTRSPRAFIPFRFTGQFHGKVDNCDEFSGVVTNGSVEARCVGCVARNEGQTREQPCSNEEARFLDENLPDWSVLGGTWRARRLPENASCSDVRALLR
jgi:hypothetical protein